MGDPSKQTLQRTRRETLQANGASELALWIADPIGMAQDRLPAKPLERKIAAPAKKRTKLEQDALNYLRMVKEGKALEADRQFGNLADIKNLIAERGWATEEEMRSAYLEERNAQDAKRFSPEVQNAFQPAESSSPQGYRRETPSKPITSTSRAEGLFAEETASPADRQKNRDPETKFTYQEDANGRGDAEVLYEYEEPKKGGRVPQKGLEKYQQMLIDSGWLESRDEQGNPNNDALYGKLTKTAVLNFQKNRGLPQTGKIDKRTARALETEAGW